MSGFDFYKTFNAAGNQFSQINLMFSDLQNFTTPGFKAQNMTFQEVMNNGMGLGAYTHTNTSTFTQGKIEKTGGAYDLAIDGGEPGTPCSTFFVLSDGTHTRYTRAGHFEFKNGKLIDPFSGLQVQGYALNGNGQPKSKKLQTIELPYDPNTKLYGGMYSGFKFGAGGKLYGEIKISDPMTHQAVTKTVPLFQVGLAKFADPDGLKQVGTTSFEATSASGQPHDGVSGEGPISASVSTHSLEMSNVDIPTMVQQVILAKMAYNAEFAVFNNMNQMTQTATNMVK
jgi:flagellar hook protein FlgE